MTYYNHKEIESKWQEYWKQHHTFKTRTDNNRPKFYALDMFPYPSGAGLHVGHPKGYTATDILSRYKRAKGYNVLHPMGWDAFGLPAEQYAIDTGNDPAEFTAKNIETFKRQIDSLGFSYDWDREIDTTDPGYYKWTQWIFIKLYENGLVYEDEVPVNWVEELGTAISNEEVLRDGTSERGGYSVVRKPMRQWMLKITAYAERLLKDLEEVEWPESIKDMQRNWIGKSVGTNIDFIVKGTTKKITVFTTRPDTLFGVTYVVLAPEHILVDTITKSERSKIVSDYKRAASLKSDLDRTDCAKGMTGVWTGSFAVNPVNGRALPIWISDCVLHSSYGTGAIMAVPAHNKRDWEFATQFDLPIIPVFSCGAGCSSLCTEDVPHVNINSDFLNGLNRTAATERIMYFLEKKQLGRRAVTYRLRDWLFSRQRYWGEPIPIIHWADGTSTAVAEHELPLVLPKTSQIKPSGTGESPLANLTEWLEVIREDGVKGRRETNTMPQWAGSSWYYLRYIDPHNNNQLADKELLNLWLPVDVYVGGAEHAVLHLLYARFWHKFLYDIGVVSTKEPFQKLFNQGMVLGMSYCDSRGALVEACKVKRCDMGCFHVETGEKLKLLPAKMSKSLKNVVNPDDIINRYGADTLRVYEMFMGPLEASITWDEAGVVGSRKFLDRVYRLITNKNIVSENRGTLERVYNETVKIVTKQIELMKFNTAISHLMAFVTTANKEEELYIEHAKGFVQLLSPFAPHLAEELWQMLTKSGESISYVTWPSFDITKLMETSVEVVVQINGKIRTKLKVLKDLSSPDLESIALKNEKIRELTRNKTIVKVISVANRLVNIVVK